MINSIKFHHLISNDVEALLKGRISLIEFSKELEDSLVEVSHKINFNVPFSFSKRIGISKVRKSFSFLTHLSKFRINLEIDSLKSDENFITLEFNSPTSFTEAAYVIFILLEFQPKDDDVLIINEKIYQNEWNSYENLLKKIFVDHFAWEENLPKYEKRIENVFQSQDPFKEWMNIIFDSMNETEE